MRVPANVHLFSLHRPHLHHRSRRSDFLLVGRWFKGKRSAARAPENPSSTPSAPWWAQNETGQFAAGEQSLWSSYRRLSGCINSQYATSACCEGGGHHIASRPPLLYQGWDDLFIKVCHVICTICWYLTVSEGKTTPNTTRDEKDM